MTRARAALTIALVALSIAARPATMLAQAEKPLDATGKWLFTVTTEAGTGTPTVTLKQQGDSLTGHYSSQLLGEAELKGTVKGKTVTFTLQGNVQGNSISVTYTGTLESADAMKGTVDFGGMGSGTFTAKRA
jgi:hypothetical protein